jgi:predicted glycosyltransferase
MSRYKTVYTEVEVEVDMSEFETDDLIEELENRGADYNITGVDADEMRGLLESIWQKRRLGNNDYQTELDKLIYGVLGKIV